MTQNVTKDNRMALGVPELAERLGISAGFLWEEIARGRIATIRLGRRVLVSLDEAKRYLESNTGTESEETQS